MSGAFLPVDKDIMYIKIGDRLRKVLPKIFDTQEGNMISDKRLLAPKVCQNRNKLDSCFQYDIRDD